MRVETLTLEDGTVVPHYIADEGEHLFATGKVNGILTLEDGTAVNVSPPVIVVESEEQAAEINDQIGRIHVANGHPDDVDYLDDPETGKKVPVQRPFIFETATGEVLVGEGTPHGEHPLDEVNGITTADADPRIAAANDTKEG